MLQSRPMRLVASFAAMVILIAAFVYFSPSDDEPARSPDSSSAVAQTSSAATTTPAEDEPTKATPEPPSYLRLDPGKVRKIQVTKGEEVRLQVTSPSDEELHVHGYDLTRELPAGKAVRLKFQASLTGVFEIELEGAGAQVAELTVKP